MNYLGNGIAWGCLWIGIGLANFGEERITYNGDCNTKTVQEQVISKAKEMIK